MHESTSSRTCTSSWPIVSCIEKNESMRWICLVSAMRCAKARSSSISARTVAAGRIHTSLTRSARSDAVQRASGPPSTLDSPSSQPGKQQRTIHEPPEGFSSHTPSRPLLTTKTLREGSPSVTSISSGASVRSVHVPGEVRRAGHASEAGEAARVEEALERLEARAALLEQRVNGRAGERLAPGHLERERGGPLERGEVEAVGELARRGLEVAAGEA